MAYSIRNVISSQLYHALNVNGGSKVRNCFNVALSLKSLKSGDAEFLLDVRDLKRALTKVDVDRNAITSDVVAKWLQIPFDKSLITSSEVTNKGNVAFKLDRLQLMTETYKCQNDVKLFDEPPETIIVEFSSPNIAKPFHLGHLRSTIIGNCLANMLKAYGHNVIRINYLGDWGTQFGFLKLGMDMANLPVEEIRKNPIKHLFDAYVNANRLAETDETFRDRARSIFSQMENGQLPDLEAWNQYREYTVNELESVYRRLGVTFDQYEWESQYRKTKIKPVLDKLRAMDLLQSDDDGKQFFMLDDDQRISLLKSDGSTLYLTRDVAAIIERQEKYKFDRMYYVVGNEQHQHFHALFNIARRLDVPNATQSHHIKFGRVEKMSTRKGNVVFLGDLLDEMKEVVRHKQQQDKNTRIDLELDDATTDNLGVSALITFEISRNRTSSYAFNLETILNEISSTGKNFQYTHSRLCSLDERVGPVYAEKFDPKHLPEPDASILMNEIARYPEVLYHSIQTVEPHILVNYMFSLNNRISKALAKLNIINEPNTDIRDQRILLFQLARSTLAKCMRIIGLTPLTKM